MTPGPGERRLVLVLPNDEVQLRLPSGMLLEHQWLHGGIRSVLELAFAAATLGWEVELRGWVDRGAYDELAALTGVAPRIPGEPRAAQAQDIVALGNAHPEPLQYAAHWLSPASLVLLAFSPFGQFGWPFADAWAPVSPLEGTRELYNQPEHLAAVAAMDIAVWTNAVTLQLMATAAGARAAYLGAGEPIPPPEVTGEKPVDAVWLSNNRWAEPAGAVAAEVSGKAQPIGVVGRPEMLRALGAAKLLIYPGRCEGEPRITREARAMGAVPVVIRDANPFSSRMDEEHGVALADSLEAMPELIRELLSDPVRLTELRERGIATARAETEWGPYLGRVATALATVPAADPGCGARAAIGRRLRTQLGEVIPGLAAARQRVEELEAELVRVNARNIELEVERLALARRKDDTEQALAALRARRAVRWSMSAANVWRRNGG
jgi:hypothetical protein